MVLTRIATTAKTTDINDNTADITDNTLTPDIHPNENDDSTTVIIVLIFITILLGVTLVVTIFACRSFGRSCYGRKKQPSPKSPPNLHIPDHMKGQSYPVAFTIPIAPQMMPHEMPRGYIHPIRTSETTATANGGKRKKSIIQQGQLAVVGRSNSEKTASMKRWDFAISRSKSVPCRLNLVSLSPVTSAIGTIDPKLYRLTKEDDLQEFLPSKYGLGKLSFSLMYDKSMDLLTIHLIQAAQLPMLTKQQKSTDTRVKVLLLPDDDSRRPATSRIFKRSLNPRFNQTIVFRLPESEIAEALVRFVVFQYDRFSHPHVIGRADYACANHDFDALGADHTIWRDLTEHPWEDELPPVDTNRGEVLISLNYLPNAERLNVVVLKARHLRTSITESPVIVPYSGSSSGADQLESCSTMSDEAALGIYVKVTIVKGGKQIKTKQTVAVRKDLNPVFNQSFAMELKNDALDMSCIVFAICLRVNHLKWAHRILGRCVVGGDIICSGKPSAHWNAMLASPRSSVTQWHTLK